MVQPGFECESFSSAAFHHYTRGSQSCECLGITKRSCQSTEGWTSPPGFHLTMLVLLWSVVPGLLSSTSSLNLLQMQIIRPHSRPYNWCGAQPSACVLTGLLSGSDTFPSFRTSELYHLVFHKSPPPPFFSNYPQQKWLYWSKSSSQ